MSKADTRNWSALVLGVLSAAIGVFLAGQAFVGANRTGLWVDEAIHQDRLSTWLETGWYLPGNNMDGSAPAADLENPGTEHAYGVSFSVVAHGANVLVGNEGLREAGTSAEAYAVRKMMVAAFGLAAAIALGWALWSVTRSWVVGVWTAAALFAVPAWTGYAMFDIKDVPAAAGMTFVTSGLILALVSRRSRWHVVAVGALCGGGAFFSVGVRFGLWAWLVLTMAAWVGLVLLVRPAARAPLVAGAVGTIVGLIGVVALHPRNAATPLRWLADSVRTSADFPYHPTVLTAGRTLGSPQPWWYFPAWFSAVLPLGLLALTVGGIVLLIVRLCRQVRERRREFAPESAAALLFALQAALLPAVAVMLGSTIYGGIRQHLYVLPGLIGLAGLAASWLLSRASSRPGRAIGVAAFLALVLAIPAIEQTRLFPYNYVYKNVAAGEINGRWEADRNFISAREALTKVPADTRALCHYREQTRPRRECLNLRQVQPFLDEQGSRAQTASGGDAVWVIVRTAGHSPPPDCEEVANVTRPLRGEHVVMSYILLCPPSAVVE